MVVHIVYFIYSTAIANTHPLLFNTCKCDDTQNRRPFTPETTSQFQDLIFRSHIVYTFFFFHPSHKTGYIYHTIVNTVLGCFVLHFTNITYFMQISWNSSMKINREKKNSYCHQFFFLSPVFFPRAYLVLKLSIVYLGSGS